MLRLAVRGLAAVLLELATVACLLALFAIGLSAYLTARFVGADLPFSGKAGTILRFIRDGMAVIAQNARPTEPSE